MVLGSYSLCFLSGGGLWFSLWLKCSGCGLCFCFLYFWSCSLCCQAVLVFVRLWSLVLFSIFLVLLFRLCQAIVCGLVSSILLCCCVLLCQAVVFGLVLPLSALSGGVGLWSCFFVWLWSLFWSCFRLIFGYGYAMVEALRLWSLVLFLLSLLGGVVALLRTRLLFVYFFLFRLLSFSSIFSCGVFLACAFCLCQVVRVELPVFFRLVEVCYNFQVVLLVFVSFLVVFEIFMLWFFLSSVCSFCLVAVLLKIRSMLVYFLFCIQAVVLFFFLCFVFFVWLVEVWLNL